MHKTLMTEESASRKGKRNFLSHPHKNPVPSGVFSDPHISAVRKLVKAEAKDEAI
ncbi:MAG: hypothetical protein ACN4GG_01275 [Akkermansiaceae bacterium]